jgi:hypothetical protein
MCMHMMKLNLQSTVSEALLLVCAALSNGDPELAPNECLSWFLQF